MGAVLEIILEIIMELIFPVILYYPGALLHWFLLKKKRPYKDILKDSSLKNFLLSMLIYSTIGFIIYQVTT